MRSAVHLGPPVHHFDLYRLSGAADLGRLQLGETLGAALSLVEWAERLGVATPPERLDLRFFMLPDVRAVQALQLCERHGMNPGEVVRGAWEGTLAGHFSACYATFPAV